MKQKPEIVASETALEHLYVYVSQSDANANRVRKTIASLKARSLTSRVLKLSESDRPIWQHSLDEEHCIYFTIGNAARAKSEVRIFFFGPSYPENARRT